MRKILNFLKKLCEVASDLLAPPKCVICSTVMAKNVGLCPDCISIYEKAERKKCGICLKQPKNCSCRPMLLTETDEFADKSLISLVFLAQADSKKIEDKLVRRFVYHVKRNNDRSGVPFAARELSFEILKLLKNEESDITSWIITNPPRSKKQIHQYGFDHAEELARKISEYTGIKYERCLKRKTNKMQKTLNAFQRRANADNAYSIITKVDLSGKNVFIVDDVITTGATLNACAHILKENGANIVFPVSIARTKKRPRKARRPLKNSTWFMKKESPKR